MSSNKPKTPPGTVIKKMLVKSCPRKVYPDEIRHALWEVERCRGTLLYGLPECGAD